MKSKKLKLLLVALFLLWGGFGLYVAMGEFTLREQFLLGYWLASGLVFVIGCAIACCFRKTRRSALPSLFIVVCFGFVLVSLRLHRLTTGVAQLESIYQSIASQGEPYPESIDRTEYSNPEYLQWYYQQNSPESFAIVYLVSSDGWAMEYPDGEWRFIGYRPDGYEPE